jgi:hypothetical protein
MRSFIAGILFFAALCVPSYAAITIQTVPVATIDQLKELSIDWEVQQAERLTLGMNVAELDPPGRAFQETELFVFPHEVGRRDLQELMTKIEKAERRAATRTKKGKFDLQAKEVPRACLLVTFSRGDKRGYLITYLVPADLVVESVSAE